MTIHTSKKSAYYKEALRIMQSQDGDVDVAKKLLFSALKEHDPYAAYALGTWYFFGSNGIRKNKKKSIELWNISAESKIPDALFDLAVCYEKGVVVERNLRKAFLLYMDAAVRGDKQAVFAVGRCYFFGVGVSKNIEISEIWFQRSEELGTYEADD